VPQRNAVFLFPEHFLYVPAALCIGGERCHFGLQ
jgi:hypothetical protein